MRSSKTESIYTLSKRIWELIALREPLVFARNQIVDKPFFLWRFWLKKPLAIIDTKLDIIDKEMLRLRFRRGMIKAERKNKIYGKKSSYI